MPKKRAKGWRRSGIRRYHNLAAVVFLVPGPAPQGLSPRSAPGKNKRALGAESSNSTTSGFSTYCAPPPLRFSTAASGWFPPEHAPVPYRSSRLMMAGFFAAIAPRPVRADDASARRFRPFLFWADSSRLEKRGLPRCSPSRSSGRKRVKGIEPSCAAWEAAVLPLNYTRE